MTWSKLILHHVNVLALAVTAMIQVLQHKRRVMSLLQTPQKLDWLLGMDQNGNTWNFSSELRGRLQAQNVLTESKGLMQYANRMLDGPLSAFEVLVNNSMLTHIQQCTEAEAHRVKKTVMSENYH